MASLALASLATAARSWSTRTERASRTGSALRLLRASTCLRALAVLRLRLAQVRERARLLLRVVPVVARVGGFDHAIEPGDEVRRIVARIRRVAFQPHRVRRRIRIQIEQLR